MIKYYICLIFYLGGEWNMPSIFNSVSLATQEMTKVAEVATDHVTKTAKKSNNKVVVEGNKLYVQNPTGAITVEVEKGDHFFDAPKAYHVKVDGKTVQSFRSRTNHAGGSLENSTGIMTMDLVMRHKPEYAFIGQIQNGQKKDLYHFDVGNYGLKDKITYSKEGGWAISRRGGDAEFDVSKEHVEDYLALKHHFTSPKPYQINKSLKANDVIIDRGQLFVYEPTGKVTVEFKSKDIPAGRSMAAPHREHRLIVKVDNKVVETYGVHADMFGSSLMSSTAISKDIFSRYRSLKTIGIQKADGSRDYLFHMDPKNYGSADKFEFVGKTGDWKGSRARGALKYMDSKKDPKGLQYVLDHKGNEVVTSLGEFYNSSKEQLAELLKSNKFKTSYSGLELFGDEFKALKAALTIKPVL